MNDVFFAEACSPPQAVILRLPMLPYSIGHEILLLKKRNPMVALSRDDFDLLPGDRQRLAVIQAALICFRDWKENHKPLAGLRLWGWMNRRSDFALAIADFRNYRHLGTTWPEIKPPAGKHRAPGSPFMARLLAFAGYNFDLPLGMAQWCFFAHAEAEGGCEVMNENEIAEQREVDRIEAEIMAERAAKAKGVSNG